jgi:hypothetical protein
MVAMVCTLHGVFVAWCNPPAPSCTVGCPRSCPPAGQLALFPAPHTSPARFDTGPSGAGGAGSRVGSADGVATRSALDAVPDALDDRPVAEGAEPAADGPVDLVGSSANRVAEGSL